MQQKLQTVTDPVERKQLAQQMNELFAEASKWKSEAKNCYRQGESIEREFNSIQANLEED